MHVAVLLSCRNGEHWLPALLDSLDRQSHTDWSLHWRDDGSTDRSAAIMAAFGRRRPDRCRHVTDPAGTLGVAASFMALLRAAPPEADAIAFADQDDVWLADKLARGVAALAAAPAARPVLYCSRQMLVDAALRPIGPSAPVRRPPGLAAALTQNIATGCTVMLNARARALVAASRVPVGTLHDWWAYLLVAAAGGRILVDATPTVLYRQHRNNAVGAPASSLARGLRALWRGPGAFMDLFRAHLVALRTQRALLTPDAARLLDRVDTALSGGWPRRLSLLGASGLRRQGRLEQAVFACWFMLG